MACSVVDSLPQSSSRRVRTHVPRRTCHQCGRVGRLLADSSQDAAVDYFRCDHCGSVWAYDKKDPNGARRNITREMETTDSGS